LLTLTLFACEATSGLNLFTIEEDIELGQSVLAEIEADPETYPVLSEDQYPEAYAHLDRLRDEVLATGEVTHADEFEWEIYLIDDDDTMNAFAAPGGYIWVYTGLMRFLTSEDVLVGVLGHEIAHADARHSTQLLTRAYGLAYLLDVVLGDDRGTGSELAETILALGFSRDNEAEADSYSVQYLCPTDWAADGASYFFEDLEGVAIPEFLSTHPSSDTRVADIRAEADAMGCNVELSEADYQELLDSLP